MIEVVLGADNGSSTFTLVAIEDTYARGSGAYANEEFFMQDSLFVKDGSGPSQRAFSYLRFDLSTVPDTIVSASVKLYPYDVGASPLHEVALTTEAWLDSTLNWNNRPQVGSMIEQWTPVLNTPVSIDLTAQAQAAWLDAAQSLEIRLASSTSGDDAQYAVYASSEHDSAAYHPVIEITTVGGGGPSNQPPSVSITMPGEGSMFTEGDNITLEASASDSDGSVTQVEYFADGASLGVGTGTDYTFTWTNVSAGSYALTAVATDDSMATTTSSAINVTVNAAGGSTFTLVAIEDTYARGSGAYANEEFFMQDSLFVKDGSGPSQRAFSYLRFDLSTVPDTIVSASVKLYPYDVGASPLHEVALTTEAWLDSTLNWNNRPQVGSMIEQWTPVLNTPVSIDLTAQAQAAWLDAAQSLEIRLASSTSGDDAQYAVYASSEHDSAAYHPVIEITTVGGGGPSNQPPSVSITMPGEGSMFTEGDNITLEASASDSDGSVTQVEYFADGASLGVGTGTDYTFTWTNVSAGSYALTAVATDDSMATTTSSAINVTVNAAGGSTFTLVAIEDTYARGSGAYANEEFFMQDSLFVKDGSGPSQRAFSYLRFDLSTVPDTIVSASVKLYPYDVGASPLHEVALTTEAWLDSTLNWNNRPQVGSMIEQWTPVLNTPVSIDLTAQAQAAWLDAAQSLEIRLASSTSGDDAQYAVYASSEHDSAAYHPVIEITTVGGGGPSNQPPSVSITMPGEGSMFTEGDNITLEASASDSDGSVTQVEYFADGASLGVGTGTDYTFTWTNVSAGSYALTAVATDDSMATTTSSAINVTVNAAGGSTFTLVAIEDTYARGSGAYANEEFFMQDSLFVKDGSGPSQRAFSYLRFDLSTVPDTIVSASVKLYPYDVGASPLHEVALTTEAWLDSTLNWNNRPQVGSMIEQWTPVLNTPVSIDLTAQAQAAWLDAAQSLEIRLASSTSGDDAQYAVYASSEHDSAAYHPVIEITTVGGGAKNEQTTSAEQQGALPERFTLSGNYPNPFNPSTTILLNLPEDALIRVEFYDSMGRKVMSFPEKNVSAGNRQPVHVDASALASGTYFYRVIAKMRTQKTTAVGQLILLK